MKNATLKICLFLFVCLFVFQAFVYGREVTLQWDANSEPDLEYYKAYWGLESGTYTNMKQTRGLETSISIQIPDNGKIYYFAVTAVDESGLESDFSNEVSTKDKGAFRPDLAPPGKFIFKKKEP